MIEFIKPKNLNGTELTNELKAAGIDLNRPPLIDGQGKFWLDVKASEEAQTKAIVAAHNGTTVAPEPTIEQKLASVGLSLPELKLALGL